MDNQTMTERRPDSGCARCVWWLRERRTEWGRCTLHRVRTFWKHAACTEYENDPFIPDEMIMA